MKIQTEEQVFDARELAKFFRWLQKHAGFEPDSAAAAAAVKKFKHGNTVCVRD